MAGGGAGLGFCHDLFDSDCDWLEVGIIGALWQGCLVPVTLV